MSPEEARSCLQEIDGYLGAAIQELIQMNPVTGWEKPLQRASEGLLKMKGFQVQRRDSVLAEMLERIRVRAERVQELLDRAAFFQYGCMSSACPPAAEYAPNGEQVDRGHASVVQAQG